MTDWAWDGTLDDLCLSVRVSNALKHYYDWDKGERRPITTMAQLLALTESDLLQQHNFGRISLADLRTELARHNLHLGMEVPLELRDPPKSHDSPDWWCDSLSELT